MLENNEYSIISDDFESCCKYELMHINLAMEKWYKELYNFINKFSSNVVKTAKVLKYLPSYVSVLERENAEALMQDKIHIGNFIGIANKEMDKLINDACILTFLTNLRKGLIDLEELGNAHTFLADKNLLLPHMQVIVDEFNKVKRQHVSNAIDNDIVKATKECDQFIVDTHSQQR